MERKYVTVIAEVKPDGDLYPKTLRFEDGSEFKIDRRLQTPRRDPAKDGTSDWRFYCLIEGREVALFYNADTHRWWIGRDA
jgi:hypothetical protein